MKIVKVVLAAAAAASVLGPVASVQADPSPYFQCVRTIELSCGFPSPEDIDAYNLCVFEGVASTCAGLPGDPG